MKNKKRLVSILTPCYNAERYISRLLDSVASQTYSDIEMIVIDDGSTDNSAEIIKSYIPIFRKQGIRLQYIYQENQGQSFAINKGLKLVKGDFLVWPDADDFYSDSKTIEKMVKKFDDDHKDEVGVVRVQYNVLADTTLKVIDRWCVDEQSRYKVDLFEDYLFNNTNSMWVVPGGYMVKMTALDECIPDREIYTEKNAGQNFQIMLPVLFKYKCLTIEEYLYNVVDHPDSHSRNVETIQLRRDIYKRTVNKTLDKMPLDLAYKKHLRRKYTKLLRPLEGDPKRGPRTFIIRATKAILPYGVVMFYKRSRK